ncbi:FIST signal transduction protein [Azospirillum melinis]|uniref:FIST signal transduction protein n=1 Tax=Azospirillum melinis TaxID=328839 RepID=UPI003756EC2D
MLSFFRSNSPTSPIPGTPVGAPAGRSEPAAHAAGPVEQPIRSLCLPAGQIGAAALDGLNFADGAPALVVGFVSPHVDFAATARAVRSALPAATQLVLVSTAGELCAAEGQPLYRKAGDRWDSVVLQSFSPRLFAGVSVQTVPLHCDDLRGGRPTRDVPARVEAIRGELDRIRVPFPVDSHDTVALTFIDGLSASESWFMEAVYRSGHFPCLFIGGSAGGKLDFRNTHLFDGQRVLENVAVTIFLKMAPGIRYGIFKSQNFRPTQTRFAVVDADPMRRIVRSVIDRDGFEVVGFIDALAKTLRCKPQELPGKLAKNTFAVEMEGELFVRSISGFDFEKGEVAFYCDVNPGELAVPGGGDRFRPPDGGRPFSLSAQQAAADRRHPERLHPAPAEQPRPALAGPCLRRAGRRRLLHLRRAAGHQHQPDPVGADVLRGAARHRVLRRHGRPFPGALRPVPELFHRHPLQPA